MVSIILFNENLLDATSDRPAIHLEIGRASLGYSEGLMLATAGKQVVLHRDVGSWLCSKLGALTSGMTCRRKASIGSDSKVFFREKLIDADGIGVLDLEFGRRIDDDGNDTAFFVIDGAEIDVGLDQLERLNYAAKRVFERPGETHPFFLRPDWGF